jgi:alanine racemase
VLNGLDQVENWTATGAGAPCALHIDTGMNRLGLRPEEARALKDAPGRLSRLNLTLIISHLACSSQPDHPMNATQLARFDEICGAFPGLPSSLASSGGAFLGSAYARNMVRPGISLYGGGPFDRTDARILPVATLDAPILQIRTVRPGEGVGYGHSWIAQKPTRIGVIGAGYADGVLRSSAANGYGWLLGRMCPLIGRISMDLCAIDLTEVDDASPGHRVELFGANLPLDQAAAQAGSIAYELLSRVAPRVRRIYQGKPE